ncbi:helix-turn-helix transcriptional regulator [Chryseobacterium sp.]|uniref:helix-turn-helix transcriptional regulator n=1 Tax=Chryseobacterium sp. TaxID=1871047 RepID=UPI0012A8E5F5|nr:WYL domain-containing protein [Chryseobacterium sp.]QFG53185.1 WYL domain-containing protein [Chryseobacterium sp.]
MAQNKNAQIRYKALDKCFANQYRKFYIDDLIDYCSDILSDHYAQETTVSRRQIFDDMDFMKSEAGYDAPIESVKDGRMVFYRYSDPEFTILKKPLNPAEMDSLQAALETLSRMNNIPGFDWVNSLLTKLQSGISAEKQKQQIISFEDNEFLKGLEFLNPLFQFILNKQCLAITYKGFSAEKENIFTVSPYYLKQYNNRWFLFGHNHHVEKIQNLALDRIIKLDSCNEVYEECSMNFAEYFKNIIGVSNDLTKDVVEVKIKLSDNILPYIKSKPVHGSQDVKENILTLKVRLNFELESTILFHGENMTVLEPPEMVERIKKRLVEMNNNYLCTSTAQ